VAGNEYAGFCARADVNFSYLGLAVCSRVRRVQARHDRDADRAAFQHQGGERIGRKRVVQGCQEGFVHESEYGVVALSEHGGVVRVSSRSFKAVCQQFAQ